MSTTFMLLELPVPTVTVGPQWASELNAALTLVDSHDHSDNKGTKITPQGLNINSDLDFNSNDAVELRSTRFDNQGSALVGVADIRALYVSGGDLYYNNNAGTAVQITSGAGLNAASIGGIGGDYATSSAAVTYSNSTKAFTFTQSSGINAKLDVADVIIRQAIGSANAVTLKSPNSLGAAYSWIFPTAVPTAGQTKILTLDSSGQVGAVYDVDAATLEISSNTLRIKDSGVVTAKINDLAVTTAKINDLGVTTGKINTAAVTQVKLGAANYTVSSSSGNISKSGDVAFTAATNLSVSITSTGRPVRIMLISDGTNGGGTVGMSTGLTTVQYAVFRILRGVTVLSEQWIGGKGGEVHTSCSSIQFFDAAAAGTYTYSIEYACGSASAVAYIRSVKLVAQEV